MRKYADLLACITLVGRWESELWKPVSYLLAIECVVVV